VQPLLFFQDEFQHAMQNESVQVQSISCISESGLLKALLR